MSSCIVETNGKRVTTDILIAGFVHGIAMKYDMAVPDEMIRVIFMLWLITLCDERTNHYLIKQSVLMDHQQYSPFLSHKVYPFYMSPYFESINL